MKKLKKRFKKMKEEGNLEKNEKYDEYFKIKNEH